jgi:hypothetical protein
LASHKPAVQAVAKGINKTLNKIFGCLTLLTLYLSVNILDASAAWPNEALAKAYDRQAFGL